MNNLMERFNDETFGEFNYLKLNMLKITNSKNLLELEFSCPERFRDTVNNQLAYLEKLFADILKVDYQVRMNCKFPVFDKANFLSRLIKFFDDYPIIKANLNQDKITIEERETIVCKIIFDKSVFDYCKGINLIFALNKFAKEIYFEDISFELLSEDDKVDYTALEKENTLSTNNTNFENEGLQRRIAVTDVEKFIGAPIEIDAYYIEDVDVGDKVFCGVIEDLREMKRKPKEGENPDDIKPFYKFVLRDFTGEINCLYFPTKATLDKMGELKNDKSLIAHGTVEHDDYMGRENFVFKIKDISFCKLPTEFKRVVIKRKLPEAYICVHPKPYFTPVQKDLFGNSEIIIPKYLQGKNFCVFDTETTGLDATSDKIIEIGAVMIENGNISQTFQSFINPHRRLTQKIIDLTNISDKDLVDAPEAEDVLSDFYKFSYGVPLIGHNINFDSEFINAAGKPFGFIFENELIDTWALAQKYLSLRRYKLDNLAKYYSIVNEGAHRALNDALTTAKVFIKLSENLQ